MERQNVIIIGGGLSGLTAASCLADASIGVTLLEQGKDYENRSVNNDGEILIGLGGAGTLTGGKLCFPPASSGIWRKTRRFMPQFRSFCREKFSDMHTLMPLVQNDNWAFGGLMQKDYRTELVLEDEMRIFIRALIDRVTAQGVSVRCSCQVTGLEPTAHGNRIFFRDECGERAYMDSDYAIFATGRTSVPLLENTFGLIHGHQPDLGIRLNLDRNQPAFSIAGKDVKLKSSMGPYLVRTFCVCCGGASIKTSTRGLIHYDGHFERYLTNNTNLGIVVRSSIYSGPDAAEHYLRAMQPYVNESISLKDFMQYHSLLTRNTDYGPLFEVLAAFVRELYKGGMLTQNPDEVAAFIPAVDNVNPIIATDSGFSSTLPGLYVTGDAAGISRGFVQAMWAGHCTAERILAQISSAADTCIAL